MVKGVKSWDCLSLILQTFEEGTSITQAMADSQDMIQPGLLKIGSEFYVKVGDMNMKLENCNLQTGLAYVLAYYYILYIDYPLPLKLVFLFIEALMGMDMSSNSIVVKNFERMLSNITWGVLK